MKSLFVLSLYTVLTIPLAAVAADPADLSDGIIRVDVRGRLGTVTTSKDDAGNLVFRYAAVQAGRQTLHIDPSDNAQVLSQLLYWSVLRHGDVRQLYVYVQGRLEFRHERPVVETGVPQKEGPWPYLVPQKLCIAPLHHREARQFLAGGLELPQKP